MYLPRAQMEQWLSQALIKKQKRGGSYYGPRSNGPSTTVTENGVRMRADCDPMSACCHGCDNLSFCALQSSVASGVIPLVFHQSSSLPNSFLLNTPPVGQACPVMWHEETLTSIRAVLAGEDDISVGYDSDDDPTVLVNKRVQVRKQYCVMERRHRVMSTRNATNCVPTSLLFRSRARVFAHLCI